MADQKVVEEERANRRKVREGLVVSDAMEATVIVAVRHRKPKSVEANMESFNRGLRALSPVSRPTASRPWRRTRSPYFWLDSALRGVV